MKKQRLVYLAAFGLLLTAEICIGRFCPPGFVRNYVGDILVTVLLCCLCRVIWPRFSPVLPVLALSWSVESLQALKLTERLHLQGTVVATALGSTFDWMDLLCYGAGCLLFAAVDLIWRKQYGKRKDERNA